MYDYAWQRSAEEADVGVHESECELYADGDLVSPERQDFQADNKLERGTGEQYITSFRDGKFGATRTVQC